MRELATTSEQAFVIIHPVARREKEDNNNFSQLFATFCNCTREGAKATKVARWRNSEGRGEAGCEGLKDSTQSLLYKAKHVNWACPA